MGLAFRLDRGLCDDPAGPRDAITDVPGVLVGHVTLRRGVARGTWDGRRLAAADGGGAALAGVIPPGGVAGMPLCTGVTAVVPPGDCFASKLPAASYVSNGFGKSVGLVQIDELGSLETPILLTNTLSVGACHEALVRDALDRHPQIGVATSTVNPVVLECNDGPINSIRGLAVRPGHGLDALARAGASPEEGDVGAGAGMTCFDLKGGIGTASRVLAFDGRRFTIGVLSMVNFGSLPCLRVNGRPTGAMLADRLRRPHAPDTDAKDGGRTGAGGASDRYAAHDDTGSIVTVIATDLPADSRQLRRMAKRVTVGIARCGGYIGNGSGEIVVAFSTANRIDHWAGEHHDGRDHPMTGTTLRISDNAMDRCFRAVAAASEETIISALLHAHSVRGRTGTITPSLTDAFHLAGLHGSCDFEMRSKE